MHSFPKTGAETCYKKNLQYVSVLYNSTELLVGWTFRESQIKLCYFQERLSL